MNTVKDNKADINIVKSDKPENFFARVACILVVLIAVLILIFVVLGLVWAILATWQSIRGMLG